jgi:2-keto-4-pentenoate hydratase
MSFDVDGFAASLLQARATGRPITEPPDTLKPASRADSFAVQDAVLAALDEPVGAWKVSNNPGTEPTMAPILARLVRPSGAVLDSAAHRLMAVECEIAFRLGRDLPVRDGGYTAEDARAAVDAMMVAIEVVESRIASFPTVSPLVQLSDFVASGGLVHGEPLAVPDRLDFADWPVTLEIGGATVKEKTGGYGGGDPMAAIAWIATHLADRGPILRDRGMKAGDIVTCGSWTGIDYAAPGRMVRVSYPGRGSATLSYS